MRRTNAKVIAFGGKLAAVAMVIKNLGSLNPVAPYACPVLSMVILGLVCSGCGQRIGWAWYGAVSILSLLMAPDREAAAVFLFLGYYPIIKPGLDRMKAGVVLKVLLFNTAVLVMYALLIYVFGMAEVAAEYRDMGIAMTVVLLIAGNVTFFLTDRALNRFSIIRQKKGG